LWGIDKMRRQYSVFGTVRNGPSDIDILNYIIHNKLLSKFLFNRDNFF